MYQLNKQQQQQGQRNNQHLKQQYQHLPHSLQYRRRRKRLHNVEGVVESKRARAQGGPLPGRRPVGAGGHGEKNIDNAFIRNRGRYKIKRILPAVKNVEVKQRGVTVRRMVARRRAIYPALRQQREY